MTEGAQENGADCPSPAAWEIADRIFYAIKHGDDEHQAWLRNKCNEIAPLLLLAMESPSPIETSQTFQRRKNEDRNQIPLERQGFIRG